MFLPLVIVFFILSTSSLFIFFFFNDTATTEIYTLSLHDALPIYGRVLHRHIPASEIDHAGAVRGMPIVQTRSEEHTSELQSRLHLVCRLLLEKKKKQETHIRHPRSLLSRGGPPEHEPHRSPRYGI